MSCAFGASDGGGEGGRGGDGDGDCDGDGGGGGGDGHQKSSHIIKTNHNTFPKSSKYIKRHQNEYRRGATSKHQRTAGPDTTKKQPPERSSNVINES